MLTSRLLHHHLHFLFLLHHHHFRARVILPVSASSAGSVRVPTSIQAIRRSQRERALRVSTGQKYEQQQRRERGHPSYQSKVWILSQSVISSSAGTTNSISLETTIKFPESVVYRPMVRLWPGHQEPGPEAQSALLPPRLAAPPLLIRFYSPVNPLWPGPGWSIRTFRGKQREENVATDWTETSCSSSSSSTLSNLRLLSPPLPAEKPDPCSSAPSPESRDGNSSLININEHSFICSR